MSLYESFFYCSTCFERYYIHPQESATVCRCIVLFRCVLVYWCCSTGVGWYPNAGWSTTCYIQSPTPEDECNNVRNMLSNKKTFIKWHQVGSLYSTSKMMHGPITIRKTTIFLFGLRVFLNPLKDECRPSNSFREATGSSLHKQTCWRWTGKFSLFWESLEYTLSVDKMQSFLLLKHVVLEVKLCLGGLNFSVFILCIHQWVSASWARADIFSAFCPVVWWAST
jgi:hypothetical protein